MATRTTTRYAPNRCVGCGTTLPEHYADPGNWSREPEPCCDLWRPVTLALSEALASWHDHDDRQWKGEPFTHLYELDGEGGIREVGNYPMRYNGPRSVGQAVEEWGVLNGLDVEPWSPAVIDTGGTHTRWAILVRAI